jgi:hypothetical protein
MKLDYRVRFVFEMKIWARDKKYITIMITFRVKLMSFSGYAGGISQSLDNGTKLNTLRKSHNREWPSEEQSSIQSTDKEWP